MNRTATVVAATLGLVLVLLVAFWEPNATPEGRAEGAGATAGQVLAAEHAEPVDPVGPPELRAADSVPLEELVALGAEVGLRLDLVSPWPDLDAFEQVRDLVVAGGVDAARLRRRALELPVGDPRRVALVLAAAWARPVGPEDEAWLLATAAGWELASTDAEQEALAAVWALDLGGHAATLERVAGDLLERHRGGAAGDEAFPGLTRIRTWLALRGLERFSGPAPLLESWLASTQREQRVAQELWALAGRTDPDRWGRLALERAAAGDRAARAGIETLVDARFYDALAELARDPASDPDGLFCASAAWKALVALDDERARALVVERLEQGGAAERELILEALHTWRTPARAEETFASLLELRDRLAGDGPARERIDGALAVRRRAWQLRRAAPVRAPRTAPLR